MSCWEGHQHGHRFPAPDLADYDPAWSHPKTRFDQILHADAVFPLRIRVPCLKPDQIIHMKLQFCGIFNGDDPLIRFDIFRKGIKGYT